MMGSILTDMTVDPKTTDNANVTCHLGTRIYLTPYISKRDRSEIGFNA